MTTTDMALKTSTTTKTSFMEEVIAATPGESRLNYCIQCGTCGGSCPSGPDMDHTPRALFAMIRAGMKTEVLKSNTPWYCVSCYYCTSRCPQEIHITDIMYTLKRMAIDEGYFRESTAADAPGFSQTFIFYVENFGRSFEMGLATAYKLMHHPLDMFAVIPMGLGMMAKNRIDIIPKRIKAVDQLKSILKKAKELEAQL
ncbi:MAG: 4Fe-4S dicluster domain-containing protein [Anaerolineaceae bacterium]